jgi:hypothetical protein
MAFGHFLGAGVELLALLLFAGHRIHSLPWRSSPAALR